MKDFENILEIIHEQIEISLNQERALRKLYDKCYLLHEVILKDNVEEPHASYCDLDPQTLRVKKSIPAGGELYVCPKCYCKIMAGRK